MAAFLVMFALLPCVWIIRNHEEAGYWGISSITADDLLVGRATGVLAIDDPGNFNENMTKRRAQLEGEACRQLKAKYGRDCGELSFAERSGAYMRIAVQTILHHPLSYIRLMARGAAVLLLDGDPASLQGITGIDPHVGIRILLLYTLPLLGFATVGLLKLWANERQLFWFLTLTIAYFVVISSGGESYSRYRVPITPLYAIAASVGAATLLGRSARRPAVCSALTHRGDGNNGKAISLLRPKCSPYTSERREADDVPDF
jgi:hypothetical protein